MNISEYAFSEYNADRILNLVIRKFYSILEMNVLMARTVTTSTAVRDGLDVLYLEPRKNGSLCSSYVTNKDLYFNFFIISLNIFIGRLLLMFFLDRIGRNVNLGKIILL